MASFDQVLHNVIASHLLVLFAASGHEKKDLWGRADSQNNNLPHGPNPGLKGYFFNLLISQDGANSQEAVASNTNLAHSRVG